MEFDPAFVNLDKKLCFLSPEERKEKVRDLTVGKDPKHLLSIVKGSPDALLKCMTYHFTDEITELLECDDIKVLHMTRGRLYLAIAQAWAREVHEMPDLDESKTQSFRKHFSKLASKARSAFRQAQKEHPEDAYFYASQALEMKGNFTEAINQYKPVMRRKRGLSTEAYEALGSLHLRAEDLGNQYKVRQKNSCDGYYKAVYPLSPPKPSHPCILLYQEYFDLVQEGSSYAHEERSAFLQKRDVLEEQIKKTNALDFTTPENPMEAALLEAQQNLYQATIKGRRAQHLWHAYKYYKKSLEGDAPYDLSWISLSNLYEVMGRFTLAKSALEEALEKGIVAAEYFMGKWYIEHSDEDPDKMRKGVPYLESYTRKASQKTDEFRNSYLGHAQDLLQSLKEMEG